MADKNIESFHKLRADEIVGPAKLYRVVSPSSGAMGDCWVSEEVFHKITKASDPKTAWRKHLAVWPDWNANVRATFIVDKQGVVRFVERYGKGELPDPDRILAEVKKLG